MQAENHIPEIEVKTNVMMRFLGDSLDPKICTKLTCIQPSQAYAQGDSYNIPSVGIRRRSTGLWAFCSEGHVKSDDTAEHLQFIVDTFRAKRESLAVISKNQRIRISCCVWWETADSHGGFSLPADLVTEAACLCGDLQFQFIGGLEEENRKDF